MPKRLKFVVEQWVLFMVRQQTVIRNFRIGPSLSNRIWTSDSNSNQISKLRRSLHLTWAVVPQTVREMWWNFRIVWRLVTLDWVGKRLLLFCYYSARRLGWGLWSIKSWSFCLEGWPRFGRTIPECLTPSTSTTTLWATADRHGIGGPRHEAMPQSVQRQAGTQSGAVRGRRGPDRRSAATCSGRRQSCLQCCC